MEPENPEKLAEAIINIYRNRNIKSTAREYVENFADKKVCAKKYVEIIERTMKSYVG